MKNILLTILAFLVVDLVVAQYCGNSGVVQCSPSGLLQKPGLSPSTGNLPPFQNGLTSSTVIQFKNYDTVRYTINLLHVDSLQFDSLGNLPAGLCWATNKTNNRYYRLEDGCIKINGTPCANPGVYKLRIFLTIWTTELGKIGPMLDAEVFPGIKYFVRVINSGDATIPLDSSQTGLFTQPSGYSTSTSGCAASNLAVTLGSNQSVCSYAHVTLAPAVTGGTAPYSYFWSGTGNTLSCNTCSAPTATITQNSTYTVTVTDQLNATVTASITYTVNSVSPLQITPLGNTTICPGGSVQLDAGVGYTNYHWSDNTVNQNAIVSAPGTYSVTVTAQNGCSYTDAITINQYTVATLGISPVGTVSLCSGSVTLTASSGFSSYAWSNSLTTQSITVTSAGLYSVSATDNHGCHTSSSKDVIGGTAFNGQQICAVSYDTASGKNMIVWEKDAGQGIDSFKIYRETSTIGVFQLIRQQRFSSFSTYTDGGSNPSQSSNRYVITTVDGCGESQYSNAHQTMLLTSAAGVNYVNLTWNAYTGFTYPNFNVYRGSAIGNMQLVTTVPSGTLTYTDQNPPSPPLYYRIEVINPLGCVPTAKTEDYSASSSNVLQILTLGLEDVASNDVKLYAFYDENTGVNIVRWKDCPLLPSKISLFDLGGREVYTCAAIVNSQLVLPPITAGVYIAEMQVGDSLLHTKLAIK